ncbi:MAG: hypothetical protein WBM17_14325 [Anaerolineales bacterium]
MTTIEMDTDMARNQLGNLNSRIRELTETRKTLIAQAEILKTVWVSRSADEFQELHIPKMNILWSKIQTLIGLSNQLNAAITIAEQAAEDLSGG